MENGLAPPSEFNGVPRVIPYHSRLFPPLFKSRAARSGTGQLPTPAAQLSGPCHILSTADASVGGRHVGSAGVHEPFVMFGSLAARNWQARGPESTPSPTRSRRA